jgi:cardiolipin synthase
MVLPDAGAGPILSAIRSARRRVLLKVFEFDKGKLIRALIEAQGRGVDCRVQLNPRKVDGEAMNEQTFERLSKAGVAVRWTRPDFAVTHEKSLVIDDTGYICTFNFCNKFFTRVRGFALVTTSAREVDEIVACFEADWDRQSFGEGHHLLWGGPRSRRRTLELIESAQVSIDVQHKKLADFFILDALLAARERGVRVRFLGSGHKGVHGADKFENACNMRLLRRAGAEVQRLKALKVHSKLIIVDGRVANLGSMNLTKHCFEQRRELSVVTTEPGVVAQLMFCFEQDWQHSRKWLPSDQGPLGDDAFYQALCT